MRSVWHKKSAQNVLVMNGRYILIEKLSQGVKYTIILVTDSLDGKLCVGWKVVRSGHSSIITTFPKY